MPNITILSKNKNLTPYLSRNFASANFQNAENMEEKRFHREEYPLDILAEFGLTEEMIYDLPEFVHETIERGGKSPLLPITVSQSFGLTHAYAKFCLIETEDGIDVMFSPKLKAANLDSFNEDERQALLLGKVIVSEIEDHIITDEGVEDVQRIQAFVQLDRDTNGVIYTPTQVIGRNLNAVATEYELSGDDLQSFWNGGLVTLYEENHQGQNEPVTIGVDLFTDTGVIVVPGTADKWENTVRRIMPKYSFGNDGCWLNKDGVLSYVPEEEFTKDILDELERLAKQHGMVSDAQELRHTMPESQVQTDNVEEEQRQLVR